MWFRSLVDFLKPWPRHITVRRTPRQGRGSRPQLGALEDRTAPAFLPAVDYSVGSVPEAVAVGHFDAGSTLDLVVANGLSNSVSVLLGNGDGTFQTPAQSFATGSGPFALTVGDLDNDGNLDVVTVNRSDISVLLGNGDGTFQAARTIGIGIAPFSVAVGDFDNDGNLDLGVTSSQPPDNSYGWELGFANVLLGDGTGSFASSEPIPINPAHPVSVAVGDVDGDGNLDLVAADYGTADNNLVSVLLGDGNGGFSSLPDVSTGTGDDQSLALSDVDGDGDFDLVTAHANSVCVVLGDGTGAFGPAAHFDAGASPRSLAMADVNGDGRVDVVSANYLNNGSYVGKSVSVLIGKGDGSFNLGMVTDTISPPISVAVGDFDGDGLPDVATANLLNSGTVSVLLNAGDFPAADAPNVSIGDATVTEGNTGTTNETFTVRLSRAYDVDVTVAYATANGTAVAGSDYQSASGTLTIPVGQTTGTISVLVNGDRLGEANETFFVNLSSATNAIIADNQGIGTIHDDEPRMSISDVSATEGHNGSHAANFLVTLSAPSEQPVTVAYATANGTAVAGSDYQSASGTLTIPVGQTTGTISVLVNGDRLGEANETFFVNLSGATNGLIADGQGVGTIMDDEPHISISDVTKAEGRNRKTTLFTFTVTLSAAYDQPVTMSYRTADGTATTGDNDYIAKTGTLTFAPGETTKTITIEVKGDHKNEADETFYLDLFGNSSNSWFDKSRGIGTILNDD
jgi:Calx-beta domain/FG-GAP-like repeat/FG-GAP repeat